MAKAYQLQDTYGNGQSPIFEDNVSLAKWVELHTDSEYLLTMIRERDYFVSEISILSYNDLFTDTGTFRY